MPEDKVTIKYKTGDAKANRVLVDFKNAINGSKGDISTIQETLQGLDTFDHLHVLHGADFDTNTLVVDAINHRVGIGSSSPDCRLYIEQPTSGDILKIKVTNADQNAAIVLADDAASWALQIRGADLNDALVIRETGVADRLTILKGGNVGIGKTNPATPLDVNGVIKADYVDMGVKNTKTTARARAYLNSNQGSLAGSWTTVQMAHESYDPGSSYDTANYKFTAPVTGYYLVTIALRIEVSSSETHGVRVGVGVQQDGSWTPVSVFAYQEYVAGHSNNIVTVVATDIIYLAQNAYLIPKAIYLEGADFGTILGGASGNVSSMAVHLLSVD